MAPVASAATSADLSPGTSSHGRLASTMPSSSRQRPPIRGSGTRWSSSGVGSVMPSTSRRTARRVRVCTRNPPSAGSESTAVRRCGSVSTRRYWPPSSRRGSSVSPTTTSQRCCRAWSCSWATAVSTSSKPVVNGSLTTSTCHASRPSPEGGARSLIRRAMAVGAGRVGHQADVDRLHHGNLPSRRVIPVWLSNPGTSQDSRCSSTGVSLGDRDRWASSSLLERSLRAGRRRRRQRQALAAAFAGSVVVAVVALIAGRAVRASQGDG